MRVLHVIFALSQLVIYFFSICKNFYCTILAYFNTHSIFSQKLCRSFARSRQFNLRSISFVHICKDAFIEYFSIFVNDYGSVTCKNFVY